MSLFISDDYLFETIEGEGRLVGRPSIFMRLSMCNLTCIGFKSPDSPFGCDSYVSWSKKNKMSFEEILNLLKEKGYDEKLNRSHVFKITGGEPFIQQKSLIEFIDYLNQNDVHPSIDFETNGTLVPEEYWGNIGASFTVSPKLKSNGDPEEKRYREDALRYHAENYSSFKFVIQNEDDVEEIKEKYIDKFSISRDLVWLMPCCGSRQEHSERSGFVAEICKREGFNFSPRLQLVIWDKALKV
jgi:organic radical activating enzyme